MPALRCLHSLSLRRKLLLLWLAPCLVVLLLAGTVLVGFQLTAFRRNSERDLMTAAQIVAGNAAAAVELKAEPVAAQILQSLRVKEHILTAVLVTPDGKLLARYGQESADPALAASAPALRTRFRGHLLLVSVPVMSEGKPIATLHVLSDYRSVYPGLVTAVLGLLLLVALVSVALARLLSSRWQHLVSEPLLRLAATARHIADQADYSVRAREESEEEFGALTRAFNQMLARIQAEEAALTASLQKMQALIHSIGGVVWECTPDTFHFTFVSRQSERIFGYAPELWLTNRHFWHEHLHPEDAPQALAACRAAVAARKPFSLEYRLLAADGRTLWVRQNGSVTVENDVAVGVRGIFLDITSQKQAAEQLEDLNRKLIETSRQIGRAEVATGVLHNVGNVLNSINISTQLISQKLRQSRHSVLGKVAALFREHAHDLAAYITTHPKGKLLPEFIGQLAQQTETEHAALVAEMHTLTGNVDHIKEIVAMQQSSARLASVTEDLSAVDLVEDALRMTADSLGRHGVTVRKEFQPVPPVRVDRHKVLQILINLLCNAKYAMDAARRPDKVLTLGMALNGEQRIKITVRDNGVGISPDHLPCLFQHGFTTRKDGHGFGLHSGLLAAKELGGALYAASQGLGQGALFTLELPIAPDQPAPPTS